MGLMSAGLIERGRYHGLPPFLLGQTLPPEPARLRATRLWCLRNWWWRGEIPARESWRS